MPRKKLICELPPPRREKGSRGELGDRHLLEILRRLALTHQAAEPQLFYPLRDAARELRAPVTAIARAYATLKKEGILGTIRGSRTVLEGHRTTRKVSIKGVIGLPVSNSCFMILQDYRRFYVELRREAQRRGFVSNLIFFEDNARGREELRGTLEEFGFDCVVWFLPQIAAREEIPRLQDRGVRVVGVADGGVPGIRCQYEIHREKALGAILRNWKADGDIAHVAIIRTSRRSAADEVMVEDAAAKAGLPYEYMDVEDEVIREAAGALSKTPRRAVILPGRSAAVFSLRAPRAFGTLLTTCRVALPDGPVTTLFGAVPDAPVDLITVNWPFLTKKIVHDLGTKRAFKDARTFLFEAAPHFQIPLRQYAETI